MGKKHKPRKVQDEHQYRYWNSGTGIEPYYGTRFDYHNNDYNRDQNCQRDRLILEMKSGNFDVKDEPRSGRPVTVKVDAISGKVEQHRHNSSYDIAEKLRIDHKTVLKNAGYTKEAPILGSHRRNLKEKHHRLNSETDGVAGRRLPDIATKTGYETPVLKQIRELRVTIPLLTECEGPDEGSFCPRRNWTEIYFSP
ncbi:hypothetical protein EVAR_77224_1 [Eumeta japonica]|uniref:Uncharacterized protein n=1 Tax=Eumeta variegata TaxID=151549 RepID=A0A4C1T2X5_EUMVA|nr:hypothetical protein EVAR_77224_1 [Eumeta japonica]